MAAACWQCIMLRASMCFQFITAVNDPLCIC